MKFAQSIGRLDAFTQSFEPSGFKLTREEKSPYLITFYVDWHSLMVGAIHLRSIEDFLTNVSIYELKKPFVAIEELEILPYWSYGTVEEISKITLLASWLDAHIDDQDYLSDSRLVIGMEELGKVLLPIRQMAFKEYMTIYIKKLKGELAYLGQVSQMVRIRSEVDPSILPSPVSDEVIRALQYKTPGRKIEPRNIEAYEIFKNGLFSNEAWNKAFRKWCEWEGITPENATRYQRKAFQSAINRSKKRARNRMN